MNKITMSFCLKQAKSCEWIPSERGLHTTICSNGLFNGVLNMLEWGTPYYGESIPTSPTFSLWCWITVSQTCQILQFHCQFDNRYLDKYCHEGVLGLNLLLHNDDWKLISYNMTTMYQVGLRIRLHRWLSEQKSFSEIIYFPKQK